MTNNTCKTTTGANNKNLVVVDTFSNPIKGSGNTSNAKMM